MASSLLDQAISEVRNGLSQRAAAKKYGVPQSTISDRMRGTPSLRAAKIPQQRLSPAQESFLCKWILNEEKAGRAPNRRQVSGIATSILKRGGDNDKLGARWIDRFLARNPDIKTKLSKPLESARVRGSVDDGSLPTQPSPPKTPPRDEISEANNIFKTPQKSRDMLEGIHNEISDLNRNVRTLYTKAAKSLDIKNAELAAKDHQIQYLQTQLDSMKPRGKRKVKEGDNNRFARVEAILEARDASKEGPKRRRVATATTTAPPLRQHV